MIDRDEVSGLLLAEQVKQYRARLTDQRASTAEQFAETDGKWEAAEAREAEAVEF